jgi:uncharacterized membrane protein YphA (DoxX/SURF4 family)
MIQKNREVAYALVRVAVGVMFLCYGVDKFRSGIGLVASGIIKQFSGKLPALMVIPFAYALPFCEVIFGVLILLGLFNRLALTLAGLLMIALTMGTALLLMPSTVAENILITSLVAALLALDDWNKYSLDSAFRR